MPDLVLVLRYRKAVTYGHHTLLAALEEHETTTRYEVRFATDAAACVEAINAGGAPNVLVLWSFYSPDAAALAEELATIKAAAPGAVHVAGAYTRPPSRCRRWTRAGTSPRSARARRR